MQTNNLILRFATTGTRLAILIAMLLVVLCSNVMPTAAAPLFLPRVGSVAVAAQSGPLTAGTPGSATYLITVTRATNQGLTVNLSVAGLPAGVAGTFSPTSLSWNTGGGSGMTRTSTLTINTTAAAAAGATAFTVTAVRTGTPGDNAGGSGTVTIRSTGSGRPIHYFWCAAGANLWRRRFHR
ncbi:MAG: hypothetical protein R2867_08020 [Caldilineaceae bacterium]